MREANNFYERIRNHYHLPDKYQRMLHTMNTYEKRDFVKKARENCRVHIDFCPDKKVNIKLRKLHKMLQEEQ
jgi:hypothetical protein